MSINVTGTPLPINTAPTATAPTLALTPATAEIEGTSNIPTNVNATIASLALTANTASASGSVNVNPNAPSLSLAGLNPTVIGISGSLNTDVTASTPSLALVASNPIVSSLPLATLFISDIGSDSNAGTEALPFATLAQANSVAIPGDIIEMQKSGGGTWTYPFYTTFNTSGTANNEIVYRVRIGDRVNFYPSSSGNILWDVRANYLHLNGSVGKIYVGDRSLWSGVNGGTDTYPHNGTVEAFNGAHHIQLTEINFAGGNGSVAIQSVDNSIHHWYFLRCTGFGHGDVPLDPGSNQSGDGINMVGSDILHVDCNWDAPFGGHNAIQGHGNNMVVRGCSFKKDWGTYWVPPTTTSYRVFTLAGADTPGSPQTAAPYGPTLWEDNLISQTGNTTHQKDANYTPGLRRTMFRYNYIFDCTGNQSEAVIGMLPNPTAPAKQNNTEYLRYYNNTYDNNKNWYLRTSNISTLGDGTMAEHQDARRYNNLLSNCHEDSIEAGGFTGNYMVFLRNIQRESLQGYPDKWLGAKHVGNMIDSSNGFHVRVSNLTNNPPGENETANSLADAKALWPAVWDTPPNTNNTNAPTYVDVTARTKAGFALASGSNGENEAEPMTSVTANSSGVGITVEDGFWLYDGFNLAYYGETGDWLAIYDSTGTTLKGIRQVDTVNSQTSVTLTASITVVIGDIVFPSDGTIAFRNVGASQQ